ncbi:unnamed protein product, partial [Effrenium voratum]
DIEKAVLEIELAPEKEKVDTLNKQVQDLWAAARVGNQTVSNLSEDVARLSTKLQLHEETP